MALAEKSEDGRLLFPDESKPTLSGAYNLLAQLPRKHGMDDLVEVDSDLIGPEATSLLIPYLFALVDKGRLRAAFIKESTPEREYREATCSTHFTEEVWAKLIGCAWMLAEVENRLLIRVNQTIEDLKADPEIKTPALSDRDFPEPILEEMLRQAQLLGIGYSGLQNTSAMVFVGSENEGGPTPIHNDSGMVYVHRCLAGPQGMNYIPGHIGHELRKLSVRDPKAFGRMVIELSQRGLLSLDKIDTGTTTIFNGNFYHGSSSEQQIAISSILGLGFNLCELKCE